MSQAQEANDPYKEYQVILAQEKRTFAQSQEDHDEKDNIFSVGNMQAKSQIASLKPIKVHVPAAKEPISLISANKQDQHFNQTIKRSPIKQFLSPQYSSHSQTKSQIRMKILLQNNRLKSNVQILRKDLDYHRENELKVAHILKESKDKIADFKFSLKEKSKRITQVTENNIQLRAMLKELKEKANQLTSYSNWQQAQIRELNTKLQQTSKDAISKQKLQEKINNLQNQLKSCELVLQRNAEKSNQFSRCSLQQQIVSVHTLSQRNPEQWKSMNDLGIDEVQMIKERQENATSSQELVDLNQFNSSLRVRIEELQGELEGMKKILGEKQNKWSTALESNLKNSDNLKDEIERANSRSASMQQYLKEKQDLILSLRREVKQMSIQLTAKQQFISNLQKDRQQQGEQFSKTLEEFREKGQDMAEKILDRENMIKKAQQDYYMSLRERQDRFSKEKKELDEIINQLTQKMSLLEKRNDILQRQAEQMARQREEVSQMLEAAKRDYEQRSRLLEMVQHFKQQNQQLNLKVREQQASYQKQLQQKNMTYLQMQGYASQISQLKNIIHNLNFQQVIKKKSQKIIQQQDELESQQQSFQKEDDLPGNSECHGPLGRPGPLQQSEPLKESSDSSSRKDKVERNHKLTKSKHSEDSSQDYSRLKEKLQQEINAHNISLADINYKLEEQRYAKSQLQAKNNELYGEIRMLSTLNMENKLSLGMKDDEINKLNAMVAQSKAQFEQHARKINSLLSHNNRQMKQKSERIFQLGLQLDRMKTQNMQISQKVITLQSSNKKYDSQRALLASQLSMIKIQNNPLLQRQLQELRQSLALPFDSQYQEETRLFLSMRIQQKEKQLETKNRENFLKLQQRIAQMRLQSQCFYQKEVVFKKASQKIELMAREIGNLEGFLDQMRTQLREADLKVRSLQQQNQLKGKQLQEKAQIINKMIAESEKASKLFRNTQQQSKTLLAQSQQIKQENQAIKAKLTQHQNIISSLNKKEQKSRLQLEQKIQALQHIVDSQVSQLQKYSRQKQQLIADNFRASSDIAQSESKLKQFSAENGLLIKKLDETQNKNSKAEGEIERLKEERDLIRKQNSELANKLKIIQEQIKIKDFKIQELDLNLANIQSSLQYSRTQNSQKLNALRESLTKQNELYLSVKMQEVSQTIKEIETLRNEIVELKNQHKATMEQYKRFKVQAEKEKQEYILRECESCTRIEQLQQVNFSFGNLLKQKTDQLIHVTNTVTEREILLKEKIQLVDETAQKIALLQAEISQITNDYETLKLNSQRQKQSLNDKIEVRKQIMQELEDDHEMRVNKLQKQVSTLRSLLTQTEKQTSVRLQQSTNSINQMQNKLKIYAEMVKQKDQELRQLKQAISSLKQQNEILKKMEQRNQLEKQSYEQAKKMQETSQNQLNKQLSELEAQLNEQKVLNKRAKIQIKQLQLQTEKAKNYISQLQNKTIKLQSNIAIYQENKVQMNKIADNFQEDIKKVKAEMAQVQRQNEISKSQILQTQAYLQDQILSKSLIQQMYQNIQLQKEQIFKEVSHLSVQRSELEEKVKEVQNNLLEERVQKAKIQHMYKQMQEKAENLSAKNMELQKAIKKAQKQKKEIEALVTQTQQYLQEEILQKSRVQEMHLRVLEQKQQMTLKLSQAISQQDQIKQSVNKSKPTIQQLKQQNHSLSLKITKMEKQHASRIQSMRTEMRDHGLQLQRRHSKQEQNLCEQMSKLRLERDNLKNELQKSKKNQKEQIQKVKSKLTIYEKEAKQFEFQRGQLTDKILQITSENNQFNQIIQTLRNDAMSKANELFQCKQLIQKLQEEIEQLKQNQPLCNDSLQPEKLDLYSLQQEYYQLEAIVYQLQAKNQILQSQINEKIKNQRNLSQKIEQLKVKQTRERNSSCDSWVSRSRIFVDEKSQNLQAELEDYKCKYESAEAYIIQLEEQIKQGSTSELQLKLAELQKEIKTKKEQIQNLQAKVEYQTAYIDHLQIDNIKNSVISKKSNHSKRDDKTFLKVDRDHSVVSVLENSRRSDKHVDAAKLNERIKSFNEFIQKYNREKDKSQLDSFRKQLGSAALDELLSTILYRLEKEANHFRQKQHQNQEILMDNQHLQEEIASLRSAFQLTNSKLQNYNNVQRNYEQTKSLLQQALMLKVKQQMQISQLKRRTKELQDSLPQNQDNIKQKQERTLTASMRREKQRDGLSVLHQENQDGSSDSMMSENADSQIPSSVNQSKDLLSSLDIRLKKSANIKMKSKTLSRANSLSNNQRTFNVQFLYTLLDKIDEIDSQVAYIQIELQEKAEKLAQMLGSSTMREQIASKLQQIQGKMHQNEKDIKRHIEKSQNELTNLLRELIRGIGGQNEYGLQNESRKKIEQYLKLLQSQLYKSKQYQQTKPLQSGRNQAHDAMKLNLHQIKEDIINEDKTSSLVNPKTSRMAHSYCNSEGVEPSQNTELKANYLDVLKELKHAKDQLLNKEELLRNTSKKNNLVSQQISIILKQLLLNFQQNQYFFQQTDKIKQLLFHLTNNHSLQYPIKDSLQKEVQYQKMILKQSNAKRQSANDESKRQSANDESKRQSANDESNERANGFLYLAKMPKEKFYELVEQVTNEDVKLIKKRIEQIIQERYNDCFEFLINQKSLILDILKIDEKRSSQELALEKLANRLTKDEIQGIINNSYNKQEARMTLMKIIVQDSKSEKVSIEDDFSPNIDQMQQIKDRVFMHPTQLSLLLHNQLIKVLGAPTRQSYYEYIEQFYQIIRRYQQRINEQTSERQSHSEKYQIRVKKIIEQRLQSIEINDSQSLDPSMIRIPKNRSTSCIVNGTESIS